MLVHVAKGPLHTRKIWRIWQANKYSSVIWSTHKFSLFRSANGSQPNSAACSAVSHIWKCSLKIWGFSPHRTWDLKTADFGRFYEDIPMFKREYLRKGTRYRQTEKRIFQQRKVPYIPQKSVPNIVNLQRLTLTACTALDAQGRYQTATNIYWRRAVQMDLLTYLPALVYVYFCNDTYIRKNCVFFIIISYYLSLVKSIPDKWNK